MNPRRPAILREDRPILRFFSLALLCVLTACSAGVGPAALSANGNGNTNASGAPPPIVTPDRGASALPGATLPCGFPGKSKTSVHEASCTVAISTKVPAIRNPHFPVAKIPGLHPADLAALYGFPKSSADVEIAVVDAYDDPQAVIDMNAYRSEFGIPACTGANGCFAKASQSGSFKHFPNSDKAWSQETDLDLEMISAVCPNCHILLVEANSDSIDDLAASVDEAVKLGAKVVSNSYYAVEFSTESTLDVHYNHPGVEVVVSAGDQASPFYPAASPYVTSVGATTVQRNGAIWTQTAWKYGAQGCSLFEPKPDFQVDSFCSTRSTVDMAAVGDPATGVTIFAQNSGGWVVVGGTSVGAPLVAAGYAISGNPAGPAFSYGHPGDFTAIPPGGGFTMAGGLGSPNGVGGL